MGARLRVGILSRAMLAVVMLSGLSVGCGQFRCGCSDGCGPGRQFALMKYDSCCERCGDPCWGGPGVVAGSCGCNYCGPGACSGAGCSSCDSCAGCACGGTACGECVGCGDACGAGSACRIPLVGRLKGVLARCTHTGCNGCGELYWNEWYNDPPSRCEPCNCHGQYVGRGAKSPGEMPLQSFGEAPMMIESSATPPLELASSPAPIEITPAPLE